MATVYATKLRIGSTARVYDLDQGEYRWARGVKAIIRPPDFKDIWNMPNDPLCAINFYIGLDLRGYEWGTYAIEAGISINGEEFNNRDIRGWYPFIRFGWGDYWRSEIPLPTVYKRWDIYEIYLEAMDVISGENKNSVAFSLFTLEDQKIEIFRKELKNLESSLDCYRIKFVASVQHGKNPDNVKFEAGGGIETVVSLAYITGDYKGLFGIDRIENGEDGIYVGHPVLTYVDENSNTCKVNQSGREFNYDFGDDKYYFLHSIELS